MGESGCGESGLSFTQLLGRSRGVCCGLFVNSGFTSRILELALKESDALLAFLFEHMAKPEFTVRWRWKTW